VKYSLAFPATGTEWWLACDVPHVLARAESVVRMGEQKLSRFLPDSSLSRLNRLRQVEDATLAEVVRAALDVRDRTAGAFDPTLGARLSELGYDATFDEIERPLTSGPYQPSSLVVAVEQDCVRLGGSGELDLGGIAKGWIVDRVVDFLSTEGVTNAIVDGGGDLRVVGGPWPIEYGSGLVAHVGSGAIATSSIRRRSWRDANGRGLHHVLDPRSGEPVRPPVHTVTIRARQAALADALATAMLVDAERVLELLPSFDAHAAVCDAGGQWWTTESWGKAA
jgi:thiamine biosynthesis lipoprotein